MPLSYDENQPSAVRGQVIIKELPPPVTGDMERKKGGWEGWAQVELANRFTKKFPHTHTFREERVYADPNIKRKADLFLQNGNEKQIIELKCESLFKDDTGGYRAFYDNLLQDMIKIKDSKLQSKYRPARIWAIGITCNEASSRKGVKYQFGDYGPIKRYVVGGCPGLYLWVRQRTRGEEDDVEDESSVLVKTAEQIASLVVGENKKLF
ncbi:hypothetical protein HK104_011040 [Borealophlyctis nickersoniae]|nr:hypothetical protein HK104_011040 [Borealophlyctis nickersoniae]